MGGLVGHPGGGVPRWGLGLLRWDVILQNQGLK